MPEPWPWAGARGLAHASSRRASLQTWPGREGLCQARGVLHLLPPKADPGAYGGCEGRQRENNHRLGRNHISAEVLQAEVFQSLTDLNLQIFAVLSHLWSPPFFFFKKYLRKKKGPSVCDLGGFCQWEGRGCLRTGALFRSPSSSQVSHGISPCRRGHPHPGAGGGIGPSCRGVPVHCPAHKLGEPSLLKWGEKQLRNEQWLEQCLYRPQQGRWA